MGAMGQQCHCSVRGVVAVAVGAVELQECLVVYGPSDTRDGETPPVEQEGVGAGICGDVPQWISSRDIRISEGGRGRGETTD